MVLLSISLIKSDNAFIEVHNIIKNNFDKFEIKKFDSEQELSEIIYKLKILNNFKFETLKKELDENKSIIKYNLIEELNIF